MGTEEFGEMWAAVGFNAVRGYIRKRWNRVLTEEDLDDLVQSTALKAWKASGSFSPSYKADVEASFCAWLFTVARTVTLDWLQHRYRVTAVPEHATMSIDDATAGRVGEAYSVPDEEQGYSEVLADALKEAALRSLGERQRAVMEGWLDGLGQGGIAERLGIKYGTVCSQTNRARGYLRSKRDLLLGEVA